MKIRQNLTFMVSGWIAGELATLGFGLFWPVMFPAIIQFRHYFSAGSSMFFVLAILLILVSPLALVGGFIGSRVPKEGGRVGQLLMAAVFGIMLSLPFACLVLWYITG
jgi:drug/metabolite transporter (DMT)-like permease